MKLEEVLELKHGELIYCGACECEGGPFPVVISEPEPCGCYNIDHDESECPIVYIACESHICGYIFSDELELLDGRTAGWNGIFVAERSTIKRA